MLACRIIWRPSAAYVSCGLRGKLPQLWAVFRDRQMLKREIPASLFLLADWGVYLWAVQNGRVLECSLGYYIQPIVVFAFGAVIFRERVSWRHLVILAVVVVGIVLSTDGFGGVPYVTIALSACFAVYAAIKKSLIIDSVVSTTAEILMMVPGSAAVYSAIPHGGHRYGIHYTSAAADAPGGRRCDGHAMVLYSVGVKYLPLTTAGFCQYLSPTLGIVCGAIMGEYLTAEKLKSFGFIWVGVVLYCLNTIYESGGGGKPCKLMPQREMRNLEAAKSLSKNPEGFRQLKNA